MVNGSLIIRFRVPFYMTFYIKCIKFVILKNSSIKYPNTDFFIVFIVSVTGYVSRVTRNEPSLSPLNDEYSRKSVTEPGVISKIGINEKEKYLFTQKRKGREF